MKEKIIRFLKNPLLIFLKLDGMGLIRISDKNFLRLKFYSQMGTRLNIDNPKTFNEKLQWLKLNDRNPLYTTMVDKYLVKEYITNIIGNKYIIPTIKVYDNVDEINFSELPNQFVIKCTHDSGSSIICKNKSNLNIKETKKLLKKCLNKNYFYSGREWIYKNIVPKIIVEKYMDDGINTQLNDYKMMCFNGKMYCSFVCTERDNKEKGLAVTFFDKNWKKMPFERHYRSSNLRIEKPKNYKEMIELSEKLSRDIPFVRVDWYEINGRLYFGELTFFPGCGFEEFKPHEWDIKLGEQIDLEKIKS